MVDPIVANNDIVDARAVGAVEGDDLALIHVRSASAKIAILQYDMTAADDYLTERLETADVDVCSVYGDGGIGVEVRRFFEGIVGGVRVVTAEAFFGQDDDAFIFVGADDGVPSGRTVNADVECTDPVVHFVAVNGFVLADGGARIRAGADVQRISAA